MSIIEPSDANMLKPIWAFTAQSRLALPRAPLWEMKGDIAGFGAYLEERDIEIDMGRTMPMQFGPMFRMPYFFRTVTISFSSSFPARRSP